MNHPVYICPACQQQVKPDTQYTWRGEPYPLYTCRTSDCAGYDWTFDQTMIYMTLEQLLVYVGASARKVS